MALRLAVAYHEHSMSGPLPVVVHPRAYQPHQRGEVLHSTVGLAPTSWVVRLADTLLQQRARVVQALQRCDSNPEPGLTSE